MDIFALYITLFAIVVITHLMFAKPFSERKTLSKPQIARKLGFSFPARYSKKWRPNIRLLTQKENNFYYSATAINPMNGYYDGVELTLFELNQVTHNSRKIITVASFDVSHLCFPAFRLIPKYKYAPLMSPEQRIKVEQPNAFWFNHMLVGEFEEEVRAAVKHLFAGKLLNLAHQLGSNGQLLCDGQTLYFHQNRAVESLLEDYMTFINQARTCLALLSTAAEKTPKPTS